MAGPKSKAINDKKTFSTSRVKMFRAYRDPHIPPKPRNAFVMGDGPDQLRGEAFATPIGVQVKATYHDGDRDFLIPYANVELVEFLADDPKP